MYICSRIFLNRVRFKSIWSELTIYCTGMGKVLGKLWGGKKDVRILIHGMLSDFIDLFLRSLRDIFTILILMVV